MAFITAGAIGASALVGAGSSLLGSSASSSASKTASWDQTLASLEAIQVEQNAYNQSVSLQYPYTIGGYNALSTLQGDLNNQSGYSPLFGAYDSSASVVPNSPESPVLTQQGFQQSPGYQYQLQQAMSAIQNSAAAKGSAISGNTLRDLQSNAQGLANQDWWNAYNANSSAYWNAANYSSGLQNRQISALQSLLTSGQAAASNTAAAGQTSANSIGNSLTNIGNSQASGAIGSANATNTGLSGVSNSANNALSNYILSQYLGGNQNTTSPTYTPSTTTFGSGGDYTTPYGYGNITSSGTGG